MPARRWETRLLALLAAVLVVFGLTAVYGASSLLTTAGRQGGSAFAPGPAPASPGGGGIPTPRPRPGSPPGPCSDSGTGKIPPANPRSSNTPFWPPRLQQ